MECHNPSGGVGILIDVGLCVLWVWEVGCVSVWLSMGMVQWNNHDGKHVEHDHLAFTHINFTTAIPVALTADRHVFRSALGSA